MDMELFAGQRNGLYPHSRSGRAGGPDGNCPADENFIRFMQEYVKENRGVWGRPYHVRATTFASATRRATLRAPASTI